uniref:Uncharacterized protein n=1 Tax=Oryza punctata TaxID=4537 RepID=A0A0E0LKJ9_ORYPU
MALGEPVMQRQWLSHRTSDHITKSWVLSCQMPSPKDSSWSGPQLHMYECLRAHQSTSSMLLIEDARLTRSIPFITIHKLRLPPQDIIS